MDLKGQLIKEKMPKHVAIIMDGNGRWARKKGHERLYGHKHAVESVRQVVQAAGELGIEYLTLYAFSTENWKRPRTEIDGLMALLAATIKNETDKLHKNNVRLLVIGNIRDLPESVTRHLKRAMDTTAGNTGLKLVLALSYSGRWEITETVKKMCRDAREGKLDPDHIDACVFESYMDSSSIPYPELLIRTSGERRISNFILWQLAYTELYFTPVLWPDYRKEHFYEALIDYQRRERRFGMVNQQPGAVTKQFI
ncbi:MAG: isoprenyl transferase [Bacteroidales bacterium]|nr:isoprenyl transferase [Bacteroidales bacterium]MBN2697310.1 isoprenyl transferase [Bacteroidales bacterium]